MIVLVTCRDGDWSGLYKDGELYYEGHNIPSFIWIEVVNGKEFYDGDNMFGENLDVFGGRFPGKFSDVEEYIGASGRR